MLYRMLLHVIGSTDNKKKIKSIKEIKINSMEIMINNVNITINKTVNDIII